MILKDILESSFKKLEENEIENSKTSVEILISEVLGIKRLDLYLDLYRNIEKKDIIKIRKYITKRSKNTPIEYILKKVEFYDVFLEVSKDVLIPRVETELLVDLVLKSIKPKDVVFDVCVGSGAIAIALKKAFCNCKMVASDISKKALNIAKKNSIRNGVDIIFKKGDLLFPYDEKADIIICNPPYVSEEEYNHVSKDVKYEPKKALVAKDNGYEFYIKMEKLLPLYLKKGGKVFFEIGKDQKKGVIKIFENPFFVKKEVIKDYSGLDRFFFLEFE